MSDLDRLIDALAECIVARQGLPNRDRAKAVLAEIEAQGWRLVPPKEGTMTDIVERLRQMASELSGAIRVDPAVGPLAAHDIRLVLEAADEIERLRTALRGAATVVRASADEIERLQKENDSLKAKLRELGYDEH